jgi:hypothetical protein
MTSDFHDERILPIATFLFGVVLEPSTMGAAGNCCYQYQFPLFVPQEIERRCDCTLDSVDRIEFCTEKMLSRVPQEIERRCDCTLDSVDIIEFCTEKMLSRARKVDGTFLTMWKGLAARSLA